MKRLEEEGEGESHGQIQRAKYKKDMDALQAICGNDTISELNLPSKYLTRARDVTVAFKAGSAGARRNLA